MPLGKFASSGSYNSIVTEPDTGIGVILKLYLIHSFATSLLILLYVGVAVVHSLS